MPDQSLLTMFDEIRGKTLRRIEIPEADALWRPDGTDNPILWHAGHAFVVVERIVVNVLRENDQVPPAIPRGWWELFSWESQPQGTAAHEWPKLAEVTAQLREQHKRLRGEIAKLSEEWLAGPLNLPAWRTHGSPRRMHIVHAFHDEACHCGEIWLIRKMLEHKTKALPAA